MDKQDHLKESRQRKGQNHINDYMKYSGLAFQMAVLLLGRLVG